MFYDFEGGSFNKAIFSDTSLLIENLKYSLLAAHEVLCLTRQKLSPIFHAECVQAISESCGISPAPLAVRAAAAAAPEQG